MTEIPPFSLQLFEATPGNSALIKANPPTFTVVAVTDNYVECSKTPRELIVGKGIFQVFPSNPEADDIGADKVEASFNKLLKEKCAQILSSYRYDVLNDDNVFVERHWKVINTPIFDDNREVTYIIHTVDEITDSVMAERLEKERFRLSGTNAYLQQIINLFNAPLQVLEPVFEKGRIVDFRFKMTNAAYAAYANTTPEAIKDKKVGEIFPGYFQTTSFTNIVKTYETGIAENWDIHYNLDGLNIYNHMSATKMNNEVIVHFAEYTKLKNLQMELERKVVELERSNQRLEGFAYAASHDLKEPVRKIQVFTERLKSSIGEKLNDGEKQYFERLDLASKRMNTLIEDLLLYSEASQKDAVKQTIDLNSLIDQVIMDLDLEIEQKGATINVGKLFTLQGHHRQLQQAFYNLIGNGLKYSKEGVAPIISILCDKVTASETGLPLTIAEQQKTYYQVIVRDNGIGFNQEYAERIFNLFTRLHGLNEYKGSGIGLSIVRQVIENHHGFIWAESQPGEGSTFKILLPVE